MFDLKECTGSQRKANPEPSKRFVYECLLNVFDQINWITVGLKCIGRMV